jgi:hypothetical protein
LKVTILIVSSSPQFTVAPRAMEGSFDLTVQTVQRAVELIPGASVVRTDADTGVVIVEVPNDLITDFKRAIGQRFCVDPNAKLQF